jgi:hypothetical protein
LGVCDLRERVRTYCPPIQSKTHPSEPGYDGHAADAEEPERKEDDEDARHRPHYSHDVAVGDGVLRENIRVEDARCLDSQRNQPCRRVARRSDGHVHAWTRRGRGQGAGHQALHVHGVHHQRHDPR